MGSGEVGRRTGLTAAALASAATHVVAGLAVFFGLQGLGFSDSLEDRALWIIEHDASWMLAWATFVPAAVTLVWLIVALRGKLDPEGTSTGLRLAVALTVTAAAVEMVGHGLRLAYVTELADGLATRQPYGTLELDYTGRANGAILANLAATEHLARWLAGALAPIGFATAIALVLVRARNAGLGRGVLLMGWLNVAAATLLVAGTVATHAGTEKLGGSLTLLTLVLFSTGIAWSGWGRELVLPDDEPSG